MDPAGFAIHRLVGPVSPALKQRLLWSRRGPDAVSRFIDGWVRPGDVVADVGANHGLYADVFSRRVGRDGRVVAFEPHPAFGTPLRRLARAHGNLRVVIAAVSDAPGQAHLSVPGRGRERYMGSLEGRSGEVETITVPTTTLDAELADLDRLRLIKCDVEGHEHEVLLGGLGTLERLRPALLVEIEQRHRARPIGETFALLAQAGYEGHMVTSAGLRPIADFDEERDQRAPIAADPETTSPPEDYVNDFVFMPPGSPPPG